MNHQLILSNTRPLVRTLHYGVMGVGLRCLAANYRSIATLSYKQGNESTSMSNQSLPKLTTVTFLNPSNLSSQQLRSYHHTRKDQGGYDFMYPRRGNRWYDFDSHPSENVEKFQTDMQAYQNYLKDQRCVQRGSKFKTIAGIVGGIFVLTNLPTIFTMVMGGALGVAAYRWMSMSQYYRHNGRSDGPTFNFQYPNTSSIFKSAFSNPSSIRYFFNEYAEAAKTQSGNYPPPDMKTISWSIFHQLFPKIGDKAIHMQKNVEVMRSKVLEKVTDSLSLEESELGKHIRQLIIQSNQGNPSLFDPKLLTFEPYADIKYQAPNGLIHLEVMAKYPSASFGAKEARFLIYAEGKVIPKDGESTSVNIDSDVSLTKISTMCLNTWKSFNINAN